jgi:hypothetical protein
LINNEIFTEIILSDRYRLLLPVGPLIVWNPAAYWPQKTSRGIVAGSEKKKSLQNTASKRACWSEYLTTVLTFELVRVKETAGHHNSLHLENALVFICSHSFNHSYRSPPYDRSIASSKASSPQSAIWCFFFRFPVHSHSLNPTSSWLRTIPRLHVTSIFPSTTCFRWQFLRKAWATQLAFLQFIVLTLIFNSRHKLKTNHCYR